MTTTSKDTPYHNRPYTATCLVTFEAAVPLDSVEIEWTTVDDTELTEVNDRVSLSEIRQINDSTFARDVIVSPLKLEDNGTYICEAEVEGEFIISHSVYTTANIIVLSKKLWTMPLHDNSQYLYNVFFSQLLLLPLLKFKGFVLLLCGTVQQCPVKASVAMM